MGTQPFYTTRGGAAPLCAPWAHPLNLHTEGVSNGARRHRHLERGCVPLWETDGNRSHDTLSREISHRNAARTIRGGDFSTPLRFGRNDDRGVRQHRHLEQGIYEKIVSRCFILLPLAGEVPRSGKGGGERSEPFTRMLIMPYDTDSQSRNALASPLGEEGHEVAKGCTRVRMIMILDADVTAERRHYNTHRP